MFDKQQYSGEVMGIFARAKRLWAPTVTGIVALALVVGIGAVAQSQSQSQSQSQFQSITHSASTALSRDETSTVEEGSTTLTSEQIAALTDRQVDAILASSMETVEEAQLDFAVEASAADYAMALEAYDSISAELDTLIASGDIAALDTTVEQEAAAAGALSVQTVARRCSTVYKWQLQTIAWIAIGYGAFVTIAGLFVSGTVIGLPAGAVLQAMGIGLGVIGTYFLWKVDHLRWNSKRVCW
ncbi:hypothetical protein E3T39_06635 [Cryobacterium suzukii]|uniref:Uncharacterized protein n=1 Tax=Cryobacterium suzukii TaxID=1259198 RepID=A0A4R9AH07_9MICO|nr:hypothetical protein [Cryobacterium suzukii]TFD61704.1 hypothetical protein E3T39_06635 [Cryobacterium suzukii]